MEALNSNGEDSAAIANVYRVLDCGGEGKPCALHGFAVSVTDDVLKVLKAHELVLGERDHSHESRENALGIVDPMI